MSLNCTTHLLELPVENVRLFIELAEPVTELVNKTNHVANEMQLLDDLMNEYDKKI